MNRIQFWILTGTSTLVALAYIAQIFLGRAVLGYESNLNDTKEIISVGEQSANNAQQIASRIYQLSQQDPALRDLMNRQNITLNIPASQAKPNGQ